MGKKVAIFDLEWGRNSATRDGQKRPCKCKPTGSGHFGYHLVIVHLTKLIFKYWLELDESNSYMKF